MKAAFLLLGLCLAACATQGATAAMVPIVPHSPTVQAGAYKLDLGDPDKDNRVFEGPIKITDANGKACTVSDDVSIVMLPLALLDGKLLYVTTYSGSEVACRWSTLQVTP